MGSLWADDAIGSTNLRITYHAIDFEDGNDLDILTRRNSKSKMSARAYYLIGFLSRFLWENVETGRTPDELFVLACTLDEILLENNMLAMDAKSS